MVSSTEIAFFGILLILLIFLIHITINYHLVKKTNQKISRSQYFIHLIESLSVPLTIEYILGAFAFFPDISVYIK